MNKKQMTRTEMIEKIKSILNGMKKHWDEKSTVENICVLMDNKIISRMKRDAYLRDKFTEMFASDDLKVNDFATKCLIKALDGYFKPSMEAEAKNHLLNAMHFSKYADLPEVKMITRKIAPFGWVRPQSHSMAAAA
ncbi:MAG: hypothetical protein QG654_561 [Patescibacteria group bacterium]|nr:hypothetical protein [Patescibacteria group bacterium]